jgi:hypothetical protein
MHEIEMSEMSQAFFPCWKAAGIHLSNQVDGGKQLARLTMVDQMERAPVVWAEQRAILAR